MEVWKFISYEYRQIRITQLKHYSMYFSRSCTSFWSVGYLEKYKRDRRACSWAAKTRIHTLYKKTLLILEKMGILNYFNLRMLFCYFDQCGWDFWKTCLKRFIWLIYMYIYIYQYYKTFHMINIHVHIYITNLQCTVCMIIVLLISYTFTAAVYIFHAWLIDFTMLYIIICRFI